MHVACRNNATTEQPSSLPQTLLNHPKSKIYLPFELDLRKQHNVVNNDHQQEEHDDL